ncbi:MAG: phosphoribosylamine--glycine ligase [Nanoarchaeota archaeon]|nr:phosphoribosylamine--glycine ligase [Nanoarchaeota archaeon]
MEPKNFLFISLEGLIGDIAWQVKKEGHNVKYYIKNPEEKEITNGFVEKVDDWKLEVDWADLIIFDDVSGQGTIAQELRKKGKLVIGGTSYTDKLEDDRTFGQEELRRHGINIIPYKEFTNFDEAIEYVKLNPARYVIKPSGTQIVKGLLFVGEEDDGRDIIQVLGDYKRSLSKKIKVFQLQKRIPGVEVAVGAFFNGRKFIFPLNVNFEHKKLFPGELGPPTGEMGTLMFWSKPNKIFNQTLKKLEGTLATEGYVGYIDLNCIVNSLGIYPLEFTARFGYPTISIQQEGMITPIGEFFYKLVNEEDINFKVKSGFQIGVRIVLPPFPFNDKKTFDIRSKDTLIFFKKPVEGVHIEDVKMVDDQWIVTGTSGIVLIVCGTGQSVKQTIEQVYSRIKQIKIPYMYYRDDIGERWFEDSDKLHNWGYLREI